MCKSITLSITQGEQTMTKYPETINELIDALKEYNDYEDTHEYDDWCDFVLGATLDLDSEGLIDCTQAGTNPEEEIWQDSWRFIKEEDDKIEVRWQVWDAVGNVPMRGYIAMPKGQEDIGYVRLVNVSREMDSDDDDSYDIVAIYERCDNAEVVDAVDIDLDIAYKNYMKKVNKGE
jgi:hypothetical protein